VAYTITVSTAQSQYYRDEIFTVTVTVSGTPSPYVGTLNLTLSQGQQTQSLGSRGTVQMYDFGSAAKTILIAR
jgi:CTP-dependent riboflavin kinase